jgi:transcriptional regulator with XRE-family HTH domain
MTSDNPYRELGSYLLKLRQEKGWSLRRAAQEIGVLSHSRLQDFERGQDPHSAIPTRPTEAQLARMAKVYEVPVVHLLRLAGYSAVGPLSEWEEELILLTRALSDEQREQVLEYIGRLM